ncbi:putative acyltransferase [Streptomyces sp. NBRC 110611]|uniref:acyltransferase family protein n=1 Tax=Streptomyces sp. NBRC 110611 TaxID=1621259 RepID=UPI0008554435|nr:acyltransferase [Streptomyces sp. NBRC 110611]GAU65076.1 putative acyltransferase [Streptomyces sp. NBRC 110611]
MLEHTRAALPLNEKQRVIPSAHEGRRTGRIAALDALRLLAALFVVVYHYMALGGGWPADGKAMFPRAFPFAAYGWLGVQLFFLISGFVICMSCWDKPLRSFFISRVVRLYPAYWFAVIATTVTVLLVPGGEKHLPWADVLTNLTMLQEPLGVPNVDEVYWTLFSELRFYLLFALVAWWGLTYRRLIVFCCVWATTSALLAGYEDGPLRLLVMPHDSWYFIAGVAFYLMYRFGPNLLLTGIVLTCFAACLPFAHVTWYNTRKYMGHIVPFWPVVLIIGLCFAVMALLAAGKLSWITWRWLPTAGALTYPLYLLHENIGREIFSALSRYVPAHALLVLTIGVMLLASWLVHRLVERPVGKLLKDGLGKAFSKAH